MPARRTAVLLLAVLLLALALPAAAAERRAVQIWSEGRRLAGDLWLPEAGAGAAPPAILMAHGWGGLRRHLNQAYAPQFAAAGFAVLTFDYRGWGDSDSRLVLLEPEPAPDAEGVITVRARPVRRVVDPLLQTRDILSALDYLSGEPAVDAGRIGLWGTSYSGGHVIWVAAHDPRVRAVVAQVGYMGGNPRPDTALARRRAIQKARGEIDPLPADLDCIPGLTGCPDVTRTVGYRPLDVAGRIRVPTLVIDAAGEELFDRRRNGRAVYDIVRANAPADYVLFDGRHYAIYGRHRAAATQRAIDWFTTHLAAE